MTRLFVLAALSWPGLALAAPDLPDDAAHLVPEAWSVPTLDAQPSWWTTLGGVELSQLLGNALNNNVDAASATLRVDQAKGRTRQQTATLLPSLSVGSNGSLNPNVNALVFDPDPEAAARDTYVRGDISADLTVPLTVWKTLPNQTAARADTTSARAGADDTRASVAVQTARLWLDVAYARERLAVVEQQVALDTELTGLIDARYRAGDASGTDLLQQRQQLAQSQSNLPDATAAIVRAERALNVHLRLAPGAPVAVDQDRLPEVPSTVAVPAPDVLVLADPTVRTALADLQAAQSRTTAAKTAFLPDLNATASAGYTYNDLQSEPLAETWSVGAQLTVPLFNGGQNRGSLVEARATEQTEALQVQDAVIDVVVDVENALTNLDQRAAEVTADTAALDAAAAALAAARAEYEAGQTSYNTVLNSLISNKSAELALLATRRTHLDAYLDVAAAAAGAWVDGLEAS